MTVTLRDIERESIRLFVAKASKRGFFKGRVLDYGCGKQPYRTLVEKGGGTYSGYDDKSLPAHVAGEGLELLQSVDLGDWHDAVLCTQVLQYVPDVKQFFITMCHLLRPQGHLVLTYPTNWPEVEPEDLHRFTKAGIERHLTKAGFEVVLHTPRAPFRAYVDGFVVDEFRTGYGVIARRA